MAKRAAAKQSNKTRGDEAAQNVEKAEKAEVTNGKRSRTGDATIHPSVFHILEFPMLLEAFH